jgi:Predicted transcriptional regulator
MPNINSNLLALRRKHLGYEQKHVAVLLGQKNKYQISHYERGQRVPSLKQAMKLSALYGLPVRKLFESVYLNCQKELNNAIKQSKLTGKVNYKTVPNIDYCSYLESLRAAEMSETKADKVYRHIKVLVEEQSKKAFKN